MIGAGAPRCAGALVGAAEPCPSKVWPALASYGQLWPAAAGCGLAAASSSQLQPVVSSCGRAWLWRNRTWLWCGRTWPGVTGPGQVGRPCTIALVQPSKVHLFIVIPIFVYLQVKIPTKFVEPH
jgi:hypothetical protein